MTDESKALEVQKQEVTTLEDTERTRECQCFIPRADIYETEEDHKYNLTLPIDYKENPDVGTEGLYKPYTRLSFVCYLRENIIKCDNDNVDYKFLQPSGHSKLN